MRRVEPLEDADRAADRLRRFFRLLAQQADVEQQPRQLVRRVELLERRRAPTRTSPPPLRGRRAKQWIFAQAQSFFASAKRSPSCARVLLAELRMLHRRFQVAALQHERRGRGVRARQPVQRVVLLEDRAARAPR